MTKRLALCLALAPFAACKCGPVLQSNNENFLCSFWDAGSSPVGVTVQSTPKAVVLTSNGSADVVIEGFEFIQDGGPFSLDDAGEVGLVFGDAGSYVLASGQTAVLGLRFDPEVPGPTLGSLVITTDNGQCTAPLFGDGIDECKNINLDGGCDAGVDNCQGTCTNGACRWPSTGACADGTQCIVAGTCNGMGGCAGPDSCVPQNTCDGGNLIGLRLDTGDAGTVYCESSGNPNVPGTCDFTQNPTVIQCDCGCGMLPNGTQGCLYSWTLDSTSPTGEFGSVWSSNAGGSDVWASEATGAEVSQSIIAQAIWQRKGGTWTQVATLPLGSNPIAGGGESIALTGDQSGDVYGASVCQFSDNQSNCGDAGIWKSTNGTASTEQLSPPSLDVCAQNGVYSIFPLSYPTMLGTTAAFLNDDDCGPELMTESNGQFVIAGGSQLPVNCSAVAGSLWGTAPNNYYIGWDCGGSAGAGGIWHYTGNSLTSTPDFAFNAGDMAYAMAGASDTDIWVVGTQRWHNDGTGWTTSSQPPPSGTPDENLWSVGDGTYFAAGLYSGTYHYTGGSWNLECLYPGYSPSGSINQVSSDQSGNYYAATQNGIYKRLP